MRRGLGADVSAGAGLVVDEDLLAQRLAEVLGDQAGRDIGALPGLVRHDQAHRLVGIGLRRGGQSRQRRREDHRTLRFIVSLP